MSQGEWGVVSGYYTLLSKIIEKLQKKGKKSEKYPIFGKNPKNPVFPHFTVFAKNAFFRKKLI